jgi:DNA-binding protein
MACAAEESLLTFCEVRPREVCDVARFIYVRYDTLRYIYRMYACLPLQRCLSEHDEVQLSALGVAISSMVTLAEILKNKGLAVEKKVTTSLEEISSNCRHVVKNSSYTHETTAILVDVPGSLT